MAPRLILVEDTHGVAFHRTLLEKLKEKLEIQQHPKIRRLPAKECNPAITRKVKGMLTRAASLEPSGIEESKILVVIDTEGQRAEEAKNRVLQHFERDELLRGRVRVVAVDPRHETWLCIGLRLDPAKCRRDPETLIIRDRGFKSYQKYHLAELAKDINIQSLQNQPDFQEYTRALEWLTRDP